MMKNVIKALALSLSLVAVPAMCDTVIADTNITVKQMCDSLYSEYENALIDFNRSINDLYWEHFVLYNDARTKRSDAKYIKNHAEVYGREAARKEGAQCDEECKMAHIGLALMAAERSVKNYDTSAYYADDGMGRDRDRIDFYKMCMGKPESMWKKLLSKHHEYYAGY